MSRPSVRSLLRSGRLSGHKLHTAQKLVLLVLVDHADEDGRAWPAQRTIAHESGLQRSGVQVALAGLVERGVIALDEDARTRSDCYVLADWVWTTG